jgi:hypothetical protein
MSRIALLPISAVPPGLGRPSNPTQDQRPGLSSAVPAGLSLEMEFSPTGQSPSSQTNEFSAAGLMRPNIATAGVPQDQLIFQLDMLRLGFVARLASMAVDELIEE